MNFDTIIRGGTVHTAERSFAGEVGIRGETIAALGGPGTLPAGPTTSIIDATGMDVLPGCLDVHVHLELPFCGTVSCDDFDSGSNAALAGGITTVLDFAIPAAGQTLRDAHEAWLAKAAPKARVDYAWHLAITRDEHLAEVGAMVAMGLPTFKEFMIYESEGWISDDARLFSTLELMRRHDGMLLVHAESSRVLDELIRRHHTPDLMRRHGARLHAVTRPAFIEAEAVERALHWSEVTGGRLYIVHLSTGRAADLVRAAQARGVPALAETCVQYLALDQSVFDGPDAHLFACCPQVKSREDLDRLWSGLDQELSVVSTDTCSFTRDQKAMWWNADGGYGDWTKIPMGLPGLDTMIPLMHTLGVRQGRLTMSDLVRLCAVNPARIMGLWGRKGDIAPGFDADIAIIDSAREVVVRPDALQSRCDWSPYEGMRLSGFSRTTLVRGRVAWDDGRVVAPAGSGRFLPRSAPGRL